MMGTGSDNHPAMTPLLLMLFAIPAQSPNVHTLKYLSATGAPALFQASEACTFPAHPQPTISPASLMSSAVVYGIPGIAARYRGV